MRRGRAGSSLEVAPGVLTPTAFVLEQDRKTFIAFRYGRKELSGAVWTVETSVDGKTWNGTSADLVTVTTQVYDAETELVVVRAAISVTTRSSCWSRRGPT